MILFKVISTRGGLTRKRCIPVSTGNKMVAHRIDLSCASEG
ncbi:MAG TPA: hypothetical protein VEI57_12430 [Nitrospirota bacterium]|nr:hypothetical protein [Nitrospirota bacterium]